MPTRSCPRCGEVVQYIGSPSGVQSCSVCGEPLAGDGPPAASTGISVTAAPATEWSSTAISPSARPPMGLVTDQDGEPLFERPRPDYTMASPTQVGVATFFGGPIAGWLLIARNYRRIGQRAAAWLALAGGVAFTATALGIGFALPDLPPGGNLLFAVILCGITIGCANALQGFAVKDHRERGGRTVPGWTVFGYVVAGIVLLVGPLIAGVVVYEMAFGDQTIAITSKEEVLYGRDVPTQDALKVGRLLEAEGYFDGSSEKNITLHRDGEEYVVSVFLSSGFNDAEIHHYFSDLAMKISRILNGKPVRIEMCDIFMTPKKKLPAARAGN